ncbi:NHLP bacteriocin export ABC transporter permease/ATPase subunit [Streptomyces montanisoli]|uniref:NHLP bacteriocin export ABC transporter permease/ATPase subunit n=1 Tax=Streptomyces montanisoli TaxID=2798581 RepID=A0A940M908_9ACTN|nr:NHLP bacteriocin export ABC transporter permease/ATPase subunit [Streptomyces montanisoli]MBP0458489.1 NHLP bacteriocin export ABC transporter permease/ATPase subunit [Streptomyces montanisoli]
MTATGQEAWHAESDAVLAAFDGIGAPGDVTGRTSVDLAGPQVLWLVAGGRLDLFAVDAAGRGPWHFLGRLEAGALLLGPVEGPRHTLLGRPGEGCALRRIPLRELTRPYPADEAQPWDGTAAGMPSPLERAFALGIGRGLGVLFEAPLGARLAGEDQAYDDEAVADDDVLWMPVPAGSVEPGAAYSRDFAGDLLVDGSLWQSMVAQQYRLLAAVDRWIAGREQAHEDRTAAGIAAGERERAHADRALVASIGGSGSGSGSGSGGRGEDGRRQRAGGDDAVFAVCRRVAAASGIALGDPPRENGTASARLSAVERIAAHARVRTRAVRLDGTWWRTDAGPLVGARARSGAPVALVWRRGGYEAANPLSGSRTRVTAANAGEFEPHGVMFYRPLPDRPLGAPRLLRFALHGARGDLRALTLAGLVTVALGALVPIATGRVLGSYVPHARTSLIVQVSIAVMVAGAVSAAFGLLQNLTMLRIEGRMEATLQPAVWDRLLRLPTAFFAGRSTGELASAAMGVSAVRRVLSGIAPVVLQSTTVGVMNLGLLLFYSVPLALVALGMLAVVTAVFLAIGLWQVRWQRRLVKLSNKLNNQAFQTLRGLPKLRVAAAESFAYAAWAREFARSRTMQQRAGHIKNVNTVVDAIYLPLCTLLMFMVLAGPARGTLSSASFLTFNTSVTMLLTSVTQLTGALVSAVAALPLYEQVRPVLRGEPEVRRGSTAPGELTGSFAARGVSFRYGDDGPLVLDGVSVEVAAGEFVAVVGPSGCGKSTLLRLLIGFESPASGSVLYDGQDLAALDLAAVRRQCGVVLQNAQPLTGSILDCVRGAEAYTQEEVWEAVERAGLADDIRSMPMGLHTMIAGGGAVSGGQRQRLMIAQALVRRPRILFFDEATSALDNETQRVVMESTRALNASRLVIAHRLSTVLDADRVVVMDAGRVVEQGAPAALLADPAGRLSELVRRQMV